MTQEAALLSFDTIFELMSAFPDEQTAIDHFTAIRWTHGAFCPLCGSTKLYHFSDKRTHKCGACRKRFSIKVGTIFEDTKIELRKWMMAIWLITSHKKDIASTVLAKEIAVTQKTAWFMLHRLRHAARTQSFNKPLDCEIAIDETCTDSANRHRGDPKNGPGSSGKVAVVGPLEPGGNVVANIVERSETATLDVFGHAVIAPTATISTDEVSGYRDLDHTFKYGVVCHSAGEYVVGEHYNNGVERFSSLLKRQIIGINKLVSPKQLSACVLETTWRFNARCLGEGVRVSALLGDAEGRLRYKDLIA